jgi:hypothetical protein
VLLGSNWRFILPLLLGRERRRLHQTRSDQGKNGQSGRGVRRCDVERQLAEGERIRALRE